MHIHGICTFLCAFNGTWKVVQNAVMQVRIHTSTLLNIYAHVCMFVFACVPVCATEARAVVETF